MGKWEEGASWLRPFVGGHQADGAGQTAVWILEKQDSFHPRVSTERSPTLGPPMGASSFLGIGPPEMAGLFLLAPL